MGSSLQGFRRPASSCSSEPSGTPVHDTGQLALPQIASIARRCGVIVEAYSAINPLLVTREADDLHDDRRGRLKNLLRLKRGMTKLVIPDGNLVCLNDRTMLVRNEVIVAGKPVFVRPPDGDVRKQINILNNLFAKKNSQSLPVDLQFEIDHYTTAPRLHKSETEMLAIAEAKLSQGDSRLQPNAKGGSRDIREAAARVQFRTIA